MHSINSILDKLKGQYTQFQFKPGKSFMWSPKQKTIFYIDQPDQSIELLLHELAHALLDHQDYNQDVELLLKESEAWEKTAELAKELGVSIKQDIGQSSLESYRDWLHKRSLCPNCGSSGMQTSKIVYTCPACRCKWHVNDARNCALRRYTVKQNYTPVI